MKCKVVVCLLTLLCFGAVSRAQDYSKADVFAGYSYVQTTPNNVGSHKFHLNGGSASGSYHIKNWLSVAADFGGYTNTNIFHTGTAGTTYTYLFGPRISLRSHARITPFAQALFGGAHTNAHTFNTINGNSAFAAAFGGGLDYHLSRHISIRPVQAEYLLTRFSEVNITQGTIAPQMQNNLRLSGGFVFHF